MKLRQFQSAIVGRFLFLFFFVSLAVTLHAVVTLTDNGNGTVTMNNGIVTMTCSKGGDVSYFALNALSATNLIDPNNDYALILTHIGGQGNDYWVSVGSGGSGSTYSVVTNLSLIHI